MSEPATRRILQRAPSPSAGSGPLGTAERERRDVVRVRRVTAVTAVLWACLAPLDVAVVTMGRASSLSYLLTLRAAGLVVLLAVVARLSWARPVSTSTLTSLDFAASVTTCAIVSATCVAYGGLESPYAHGISCLLVSRALTLAQPWKRGIWSVGAPALTHPLTLLASASWSPLVASQLGDATSLMAFAEDTVFITITAAALVTGSHVVWSIREQVFAARNLGQYTLQRRIGSGGMGEVWLAWQSTLSRNVALKILRPHPSMDVDVAAERFEREVRAMSKLSHPNSVRVLDYGLSEDGLRYFAMELLDGATLDERVAMRGPFGPARALRLVAQAARALAEAHAFGIVHRDVKPDNVFIARTPGGEDQAKLLDFGIARVESAGESALTGTDWIVGTPRFMSPEQASGQVATFSSDLYSLGAVLYFALTGAAPFERANDAQIMVAHIQSDPLPPSALVDCSLEVDHIVLRCLAKHPAARYASAHDLARALEACALRLDGGDAQPAEHAPVSRPEAPTSRLRR